MLPQRERSFLAKLGFFLCQEGDLTAAESVFRGLDLDIPDRDGPAIGFALCRIIAGKTDEALALLDARLARAEGPAPAPVLLYKIVALSMGGRLAEAESLRDRIRADGDDKTGAVADQVIASLRQSPAK